MKIICSAKSRGCKQREIHRNIILYHDNLRPKAERNKQYYQNQNTSKAKPKVDGQQ